MARRSNLAWRRRYYIDWTAQADLTWSGSFTGGTFGRGTTWTVEGSVTPITTHNTGLIVGAPANDTAAITAALIPGPWANVSDMLAGDEIRFGSTYRILARVPTHATVDFNAAYLVLYDAVTGTSNPANLAAIGFRHATTELVQSAWSWGHFSQAYTQSTISRANGTDAFDVLEVRFKPVESASFSASLHYGRFLSPEAFGHGHAYLASAAAPALTSSTFGYSSNNVLAHPAAAAVSATAMSLRVKLGSQVGSGSSGAFNPVFTHFALDELT